MKNLLNQEYLHLDMILVAHRRNCLEAVSLVQMVSGWSKRRRTMITMETMSKQS